MPPIRRLVTPLLAAAALVLLVGCRSVIEVAVDLHEGAETADVTVTVLGDETGMFARYTSHLDRTDPPRAEAVRHAARMDTTGDVERVLDEAGVSSDDFDDYVAHVLERELEVAEGDSYAEVQRRQEAGTLTFTSVERGALRGQAMTFTDVAVEEIPETLDEVARVDRDSSLEEVIVSRDGDAVTVAFATGKEQDGADLSAVSPFEHDLVVTVPGEVVEHNAKDVDGARLEWNQAAIAEPTVTYLPGPTADRDATASSSAPPEDETVAEEADSEAVAGGSRSVDARGAGLTFGTVLVGLIGLALIGAVVAAVLLDRRVRRRAPQPVRAPVPTAAYGHPYPAAPVASHPSAPPVAGWYGDPTGRARLRWWDGHRWTDHQR